MAAVEIDETELAGARQLAGTVNAIMGNPKSRRMMQEAYKIANPNAVIPEIDAAKPIMDEVSAVREELAALRKGMTDDKDAREAASARARMETTWESGRRKLRAQKYTDEGLASVEKLMEDRGIADHEAAAALWERHNPPPAPTTGDGRSKFDIFNPTHREDLDVKSLLENPDAFADRMTRQVLSEMRSGQ